MTEPMNVFSKKAESVTYCWEFGEFPLDKITKIKRMFNVELCGQMTIWSLNVKYDTEYDHFNEYSINLLHHGRSIVNVVPELTTTLYRNNRSPIVYEEKLECILEGDWECYFFEFNTEKPNKDEINYRLKLEVCISYNLLEKCATDELWSDVKLPSGLNADLQELLKWERGNSDLEIATKTEKFYVSREQLSQRSIGFYKMYAYEKCKKNEVLKIEDVKVEAVREMLRYLYMGSVNSIKEVAEDLMVLAHRYDIPRLKIKCEDSLVIQVKKNNVEKMAELAERYQLKKLQKEVARLQR